MSQIQFNVTKLQKPAGGPFVLISVQADSALFYKTGNSWPHSLCSTSQLCCTRQNPIATCSLFPVGELPISKACSKTGEEMRMLSVS